MCEWEHVCVYVGGKRWINFFDWVRNLSKMKVFAVLIKLINAGTTRKHVKSIWRQKRADSSMDCD